MNALAAISVKVESLLISLAPPHCCHEHWSCPTTTCWYWSPATATTERIHATASSARGSCWAAGATCRSPYRSPSSEYGVSKHHAASYVSTTYWGYYDYASCPQYVRTASKSCSRDYSKTHPCCIPLLTKSFMKNNANILYQHFFWGKFWGSHCTAFTSQHHKALALPRYYGASPCKQQWPTSSQGTGCYWKGTQTK